MKERQNIEDFEISESEDIEKKALGALSLTKKKLQNKKNKYTGIQDYYRVKSDDTLYAISQQFGIKMSSLAKMNNKDMFSRLQEGERLMLK